MKNINIVIMGKIGAGKSTLVNALMGSDVAPVGRGGSGTKENKIYSRSMQISSYESGNHYCQINANVNFYDTVGLELDSSITQKTLKNIKGYIEEAQKNKDENNINVVWFCVNYRCHRFEEYEINLIRDLLITYEIPFIVVITQCDNNEHGHLERQIEKDLPEVTVIRILAKDSKILIGVLKAFGLPDLVSRSVFGYNNLKIKVLESKLDLLRDQTENLIADYDELRQKVDECIEGYSDTAVKIGWVPVACIPIIHGLCIKMICELCQIVGISTTKEISEDIFVHVILGVVVTPFMTIPILSAGVAVAYIQTVGEEYRDTLFAVIEQSNCDELNDKELMAARIKEELLRRKK